MSEPLTIENCRKAVFSDDVDQQLRGCCGLRSLLSLELKPPIQEAIDAGVVPRLIEFLHQDKHSLLQFQAAWALTNVASGATEHTSVIVEHGAVPAFVKLLESPDENVREQASWALGNIAGDRPEYRDLVLSENALPLLSKLALPEGGLKSNREPSKSGRVSPPPGVKLPTLTAAAKATLEAANKSGAGTRGASMRRNCTWSLTNLCRGRPPPPFSIVKDAIRVFSELIQHDEDVEVIVDACWGLSYLSDGPSEQIQAVIQAGCLPMLVALLDSPIVEVLSPTIRTIGNLVTGSDTHTQMVVEANVLTPLRKLVASSKPDIIRKEAIWTLSNVAAGSQAQVIATIIEGAFETVTKLVRDTAAPAMLRREGTWVVSNATERREPPIILLLAQRGAIEALVASLSLHPRQEVILVALDGLHNMLVCGSDDRCFAAASESTAAEKATAKRLTTRLVAGPDAGKTVRINPFAVMVERAGGVKVLSVLQFHPNEEIHTKARLLLSRYWRIGNTIPVAHARAKVVEAGVPLPRWPTEGDATPAAGVTAASEAAKAGAGGGAATVTVAATTSTAARQPPTATVTATAPTATAANRSHGRH